MSCHLSTKIARHRLRQLQSLLASYSSAGMRRCCTCMGRAEFPQQCRQLTPAMITQPHTNAVLGLRSAPLAILKPGKPPDTMMDVPLPRLDFLAS